MPTALKTFALTTLSVFLISGFILFVPNARAAAHAGHKAAHHSLKTQVVTANAEVDTQQADQNSSGPTSPAKVTPVPTPPIQATTTTSHTVAPAVVTPTPPQTTHTPPSAQRASAASAAAVSAQSNTDVTAQSTVSLPDTGTIYTRATSLPAALTLTLLLIAFGMGLLGTLLIRNDSPEDYRVALAPNAYGSRQSLA
jgi:hypothetical protein